MRPQVAADLKVVPVFLKIGRDDNSRARPLRLRPNVIYREKKSLPLMTEGTTVAWSRLTPHRIYRRDSRDGDINLCRACLWAETCEPPLMRKTAKACSRTE